ncbi:MAG TPA: hypothetical protein VIY72_15635, partial [Acidimicrobiales bacterium]
MAAIVGVASVVTGCASDSVDATGGPAFDDCANSTEGPASIVGFDPQTGEESWHRLAGDRVVGFAIDDVLVAQGFGS